jgi:hypothetical protein
MQTIPRRQKNFLPFLLAALIISVSSCGLFFSDNPCRKYIDKRKMTEVMTDVYLLEGKLSQLQTKPEIIDSVAYYYADLFDKHDITAQQFEDAFNCYMLDSDNLTWLMDEVLSSLSIIQSRVDEKKEN